MESLFTVFFNEHEVTDFASAGGSDMDMYAAMFHSLLDDGVYIAPSGYEAWFVSLAHTDEHRELTLAAVDNFLAGL